MLASKLGASYISLGELVKEERLYSGIDGKRGSLVADMNKVSKRVNQMISSSERDTLVDGHYAPDVIAKNTVRLVFVLRRNPEELKAVLEERGFKGEKLWENLAAEILDACLWDAVSRCGAGKVCEIDVTSRSVEEVVNDMISTINNEKECRTGQVDWLGRLEAEGKLDTYLRHF